MSAVLQSSLLTCSIEPIAAARLALSIVGDSVGPTIVLASLRSRLFFSFHPSFCNCAFARTVYAPMSNEERLDSNPYAYPYFHSDGSGPLLYRLVVEAEELLGSGDASSDDNDDTSVIAKASHDLLRRIRSRCICRPVEATWADSCGDNALHRLCQAAKFGPVRRIVPTGGEKEQQRSLSWDDMALTTLKSILESSPMVASAKNSWHETPLHQFASHCGIAGFDDVLEDGDGATTGSTSPTTGEKTSGMHVRDVAYPQTSDEMLQLLLQACPGSAYLRNYLLAAPLHEACSLSHGPNALMRRFVPDLSSNQSSSHISKRNDRLDWMRKRQRLVIRRLVAACPGALFVGDKMGRTCLFRAVESDRSGGDVVAVVLDEIEKYCLNVLKLKEEETCNVIRSMATGEVAETDVASELARFAQFSAVEKQHVDRVDDQDVRRAVRCLADGKVNGNARNRRSPLEFLVTEWQWTPRNLGMVRSPTSANLHVSPGILAGGTNRKSAPSRTTVSTLVTASLREGVNPRDIIRQLGPLWEKTILILRAAQCGSIRDRPSINEEGERWKLLHAAILFSCPKPLIQLLCELNPSQLLQRDSFGRTPLLMACQMRSSDPGENDRCVDVINLLLRKESGACRMVNAKGNLPLHIAIQSGHEWNMVLKPMLAAEPRALRARAPGGLYPFMLAASAGNRSGGGKSKRLELQELTSVFELLRADPSAASAP